VTALRVLVVDDELFIRTSVSMMLTLEGHKVTCAPDGDEALRLALQLRPDVILTDLHMAHLDGMGLLAAVRGNPLLADTRVVLLSGESPSERDAPSALQADARLTKPFTRAQLLAALGPLPG